MRVQHNPKSSGSRKRTGIYFKLPGYPKKDIEVTIADEHLGLMKLVPTITENGRVYVDGDGQLPKPFKSVTNFSAFKQKIQRSIPDRERQPRIWRSRLRADDETRSQSTMNSET